MSKENNKIIQDVYKLAGSVFTTAINVKNDIGEFINQQIEDLLKKRDFVSRREFEVMNKIVCDSKIQLSELEKKYLELLELTSKNQVNVSKYNEPTNNNEIENHEENN